jgi:sugar O-acyltransferase (sialic acid O-acetyltransferase NeuD family)
MNNSLVIWGAGGHGRVVLDVARSSGHYEHIVFLDDDAEKSCAPFCDCAIIGGNENLKSLAGQDFVVAVGDNHARAHCFDLALTQGLSPTVLIHASAIVSPSASIGRGSVVMPGAIVNAGAVIGEDCIVNTAAVIEHDCKIGAHAHVSSRAVLGGNVNVGELALVGIGAILLPCATIGEESIVGAGSVVLKKAPARCTVVGVPAKAVTCA